MDRGRGVKPEAAISGHLGGVLRHLLPCHRRFLSMDTIAPGSPSLLTFLANQLGTAHDRAIQGRAKAASYAEAGELLLLSRANEVAYP